jgi:OmpA-OmpF porin, OOP family
MRGAVQCGAKPEEGTLRSLFQSPGPRSRRTLCRASFASALVLLPAVAHGQARVEPDFSVQRFTPAPGPRNYLVTRGARTDGKMSWSGGLTLSYGYQPLVIVSCIAENGQSCEDEEARQAIDIKVVENLITADLMGTLTPIPQLQLGLRLPVTWTDGQGIEDDGLSSPDGLSGFGLGDPELEAKFRAYGEVQGPFVLGVAANVSAPLGEAIAEDKYIGDKTPTAGVRVIIDGLQHGFGYAVNLGGAFRGESQVGSAKIGSEARFSAGAGYQVSPVFRPIVDLFGSTRFTSTAGESALEALLAVQIQPLATPVMITVGAGTTLLEGVGVPNVRAVLGAMYIAERNDDDQDGIGNNLDQCPTEAEDRDGYEDGDGCPDRDNDLDTIADTADKCPSQPEDQDGFEDTDGCPDLDNDKDGFADTGDQCPAKPETRNNYKDEDGCPDESDVDNDGVPDDRDKCPTEAEDTDGFEDTDGCPDPDNDKDGVLDEQDECIEEPEILNEFEDTDGCPDEAPADPKKRR